MKIILLLISLLAAVPVISATSKVSEYKGNSTLPSASSLGSLRGASIMSPNITNVDGPFTPTYAPTRANGLQWHPIATAPPGNSYAAMAANNANYVWRVGGQEQGSANGVKTTSSYNLYSNTWTAGYDLNVRRLYTAAVGIGSYVYALGGSVNGNNMKFLATVEYCDTMGGTPWVTSPYKMNTPRIMHAAAVIGTVIYVSGGNIGDDTSVEYWDTAGSDGWIVGTPMLESRQEHLMITISAPNPSGLLAIGGEGTNGVLASTEWYALVRGGTRKWARSRTSCTCPSSASTSGP